MAISYSFTDYQGLAMWTNYEMKIYTDPDQEITYGGLLFYEYSYGEEDLVLNRLNSWERKELECYEEGGNCDDVRYEKLKGGLKFIRRICKI